MTSGFAKSFDPGPLDLERAFLFYRQRTTQRVVVREHEVCSGMNEGEDQRLGPGRFVTREFLQAIESSIDRSSLEYMPAHVLAKSQSALAWWEPAQTRTMFFQAQTDTALTRFSGQPLPHPPLVFIASTRGGHGGLAVYALLENERPCADTALMRAPYWNIYDGDRMCVGSTPLPTEIATSDTAAWSSAFFASAFTHLSSTGRWTGGCTYAEFLASVDAAGVFDSSWLVSARTSLASAIAGT
jgi:PRTRC genetic system protein B